MFQVPLKDFDSAIFARGSGPLIASIAFFDASSPPGWIMCPK